MSAMSGLHASASMVDGYRDLRQEVREVSPLIQALRDMCGDDEQAFLDMVEGETDVTEAARRVVRWMLEQEANAVMCKGLAATYSARAGVFSDRHERAKGALLDFLNELGVKSMPLPEATITAAKTPAKVVGNVDAALLPDALRRTTYAPDLVAIKAELDEGREVGGYALSNGGQTLKVKVR